MSLPYDSSSISGIKIGSGLRHADENGMIRDERKDQVILKNPEAIQSFLGQFCFANEHMPTVKHRLSAYVEFYAGDSLVGHINFEHKIMRRDGREYYLCEETAAKLAEFLRGDTQSGRGE